MRRGLAITMTAAAIVGLTGSANAAEPGPVNLPFLPAVQATVKDACTGLPISGLLVSLVDSAGAATAASKVGTGSFQFASMTAAGAMLHVSAPGYVALNGVPDNGVPDNGVPMNGIPDNGIAQGGVSGNGTGSNGVPVNGPGGIRWEMGWRLGIVLTPTTGCAHPRAATVPAALVGRVLDRQTGAPVSGLVAAALPDPLSPVGQDPGPIQLGTGKFIARSLPCGAYSLTLSAPGYLSVPANSLFIDQHSTQAVCGGPLSSGDVAYETLLNVLLRPAGFDQPPRIESITASANGVHPGDELTFAVQASDPDGDAVTGSISAPDPAWTFTLVSPPNTYPMIWTAKIQWDHAGDAPTEPVTFTFGDALGATTSRTLNVEVLAPSPVTTTTTTLAPIPGA